MSVYDVDEYRIWSKAKDLFVKERATILSWYPKDTPPLGWHEIGREARLMWWEKAAEMMRVPSELPTRPELPFLPKRVITLVGV